MDMDFAVSGPLVRRSRLVSGSCPSTRTFALRFLQTSPRGDSPCVVANPSPPSGWVEDFHLQVTEHAQHTTKSLRDSPLKRGLSICCGNGGRRARLGTMRERPWKNVGCFPAAAAASRRRDPAARRRLPARSEPRFLPAVLAARAATIAAQRG